MRKAKWFVFLRLHRQEIVEEAFPHEWASLSQEAERGQPPVAPAMLALALMVEAYTGVSDDEVIEATMRYRRWHLVLDGVDTQEAPFRKGTWVAFRKRLIEGPMDRRLIERTIEMASQSHGFGPRAFRAALDRSPLWGAGRVEDPLHWVGHALGTVIRVVADQRGRERVEVAKKAGERWSVGAVSTRRGTAIGISTGRKRGRWAWSGTGDEPWTSGCRPCTGKKHRRLSHRFR
jgi:transposase